MCLARFVLMGEDEVAEVVGAELPLQAVRGRAVRAGHDAGVEHQHVDGDDLVRGSAHRGE